MPAVIIDIAHAEDGRDVVHRAVQALAEGKLVAFPTETVYGLAASALHEEGVQRLIAAKGRKPGHPFALAVKGAADALDYVPDISPLGRRLAQRCWPGPVTLVFDDHHPDSLIRRLPANVRQAVAPTGTVGLRVPAHPLILEVQRLLPGPLVLTSANKTGEKEALTGQEVMQSLADDVHLILDDSRCQFGQPSTVVRVTGRGYQVLRAGVVTESTVHRLASFVLLLVCTGNTCRSPMSEVLAKAQIAKRLNCPIDKLEERGVIVLSAGLSAMPGGRAATEAVEVMKQRGLDLSGHESQPVTDRIVNHADLILTMTRSHRQGLLSQWPSAASRTFLVSPSDRDIADPIGSPLEHYEACANRIDAELAARLDEMDLESLIAERPATS